MNELLTGLFVEYQEILLHPTGRLQLLHLDHTDLNLNVQTLLPLLVDHLTQIRVLFLQVK